MRSNMYQNLALRLVGLAVFLSLAFSVTTVAALLGPDLDARLSLVEGAAVEVGTNVGALAEKTEQLRRAVDDVIHPVDPLPPTKPKPGYLGTQDCCEADLIRKDCWDKIDNLPLTVLGQGVYYFYTDLSNPLTWFRAQDFCRRHGMQLVSIEDAQEDALLRTQVQSLLGGQTDSRAFFWTSNNDLSTENTFIWAGTGQPVGYTNWHLGQPDNLGDEDCGEIWQQGAIGNVRWNERSCTGWKGRFICELLQPCADLVRAKAIKQAMG